MVEKSMREKSPRIKNIVNEKSVENFKPEKLADVKWNPLNFIIKQIQSHNSLGTM